MAPRPDDWMVEVELVEDDGRGTDAADDPPRDSAGHPVGDGPAGPTPGRRRWLRAGVVVVVAAVAAVTLNVVVGLTRGDADEHRLDHPLAGSWTLSRGAVLGVADGVVAVRAGTVVTGYGEDDGEVRWSLELGIDSGVDACASAVTTDPGTLWCWRSEQPVVAENGRTEQRTAALVGVDIGDGTLATVREMPVPWAGLVAVGGDLVLGERVRGDLTLTRVDAGSWRQVWVSELVLAPMPTTGDYAATIEAVDGVVVVHGPTAAVVDADDGRVLGTWEPPFDDTVSADADGADVTVTPYGFAASNVASVGNGAEKGVWYDTEGREVVEYDGVLAEPASSDGSEPGVVLVSRRNGSELVGVDAGTGADLWTLPTDDAITLSRHDGTVVVATGEAVTCLELFTGWQLWSSEVVGLRTDAGGVSDGDVAVVMAVQSREWVFVAYDLATGDRVWFARAAGAPDLENLFYIGGAPRLAMVGDRAVVQSAQGTTWLG